MSSCNGDSSTGIVTSLKMLILVSASVFLGAAIAVVASFFVALFTQVNLGLTPDVPWFVIPALVIAVGTVLASTHWFEVIETIPAWPVWQSLLASVLIAVAIAVFAIATMGTAAVRSGQWSMVNGRFQETWMLRRILGISPKRLRIYLPQATSWTVVTKPLSHQADHGRTHSRV